MRARHLRVAVALGLAWSAAAVAAPDMRGKTYMTLDGPAGNKPAAGTPVLKSITARYNVTMRDGRPVDVMPEFHFVAPRGNAVLLHRVMVETDSALTAADIRSASVTLPAARQMAGATIRGGWACGPGRYHVTLRAWLEDANGNKGNALQYTIHCHELVMF